MRITTPFRNSKEKNSHTGMHECPGHRPEEVVVDLLRAYSKRSDLLFELASAVECLQLKDVWTADTGRSVRSEQAPSVWRISDRLTEADIRSLASSYRAGTAARELAEQFKISKSSVKQILRERGIRRTSPAA
jgi:predicted DNA binding protein